MGAIVLAAFGASPGHGGSGTAATAAATGLGVSVAHVFRGVFALGVLCPDRQLDRAWIRMEEAPACADPVRTVRRRWP